MTWAQRIPDEQRVHTACLTELVVQGRGVWKVSHRALPPANMAAHFGHRGRKRFLGLGKDSVGRVLPSLANQ